MAQARTEIAKTQAQFEALNAAARQSIASKTYGGGQIAEHAKIESLLHTNRNLMRDTAVASGEWRVSTQRIMSQSERMNDLLQRQRLGVADIARNWRNVGSAMRQQMRLQQSLVGSIGTDQEGRVVADLYTPVGIDKNLSNLRMQYGYINQMIGSIAGRTIDWGKNTQWAGRQIMVAVGIPLGMAAAAAGVMAYKVDAELTRIAKVYDTTADTAVGREIELRNVREVSLNQAIRLAKEYGVAVNESLDVQAQLAATGLNGQNLLNASSEVVRISALGELDLQTSVDMTVALQSAFRLTNKELTETFNLMNSLENATSLSINDFAEGIPRAASALAGLGGSVEDMGVMLVAMKEAGVQATEGANALKSSTTRILNPTARAVSQFEALDINIKGIVESSGGKLIDVFKALSTEMNGIDPLKAQQAIASLFGTYQFNRINAVIQNLAIGMGLVEGQTNQTARAFAVLDEGAGAWATSAQEEILRFQNSSSGQSKRYFESIKAQLAAAGEPILDFVLPIIKAVNMILERFNEMPAGAQKIALIAGAFFMLIGPSIMLTGVMANMFGQIVKTTTSLANLGLRFKIMDKEQMAQALLAKTASGAYDQQAASVARLTLAMQAANQMMARSAGFSSALLNPAGPFSSSQLTGTSSIAAVGAATTAGQTSQTAARSASTHAVVMQNATAKSAENTGKTAAHSANIARGLGTAGLAASLLTASIGNANGATTNWIQGLSTGAFILSMMPGTMGKLVGGMGSAVGRLGGMGAGLANAGRFLSTLLTSGLKFWGPVGILASGLLILYKINESMKEGIRNQEALNQSGEKWAGILGYTYNLGALGGEVNPMKPTEESIKAMRKEMPELVQLLRQSKDIEEAIAVARNEANRVLSTGGSIENAAYTMRVSVAAAGFDPAQAERFVQEYTEEMEKALEAGTLGETLTASTSVIIKESLDEAFAAVETKNWWERLLNPSGASYDAIESGKKAAQYVVEGMAASGVGSEGASNILDDLEAEFASRNAEGFDAYLDKNSQLLDQFGVSSLEEARQMQQAIDNALTLNPAANEFQFNGMTHNMNAAKFALDAYRRGMDETTDTQVEMLREIARTNQVGEEEIKTIRTISDLRKALNMNRKSEVEIMKIYDAELRKAVQSGNYLNQAQRDALLESIRMSNGLDQVSAAARGTEGAVEDAADAVGELDSQMQELAPSASDYTNALKDMMSSATNAVGAEASRVFAEQNEREIAGIQRAGDNRIAALEADREASANSYETRMNALKKSNEAAMKAFESRAEAASEALKKRNEQTLKDFDNRWEATLDNHSTGWEERIKREEKVYDARIEAIENQIDAEEKAEEARQQMFDNEIERIERLAEAQNRNVDINSALNTGNFDEAAKLVNDSIAGENVGAIEAARNALAADSDTRIEAYQGRLERIKEEKDVRLEALKSVEEAEKKALDDKKDREREALQETLRNNEKAMADRNNREKEMLQNSQKNQEDQLNAQKAANQKALDAQIANERARTSQAVDARKREQEAMQRRLDAELEALRATIPTNEREYNQHIARLEGIYDRYGLNLKTEARGWNNTVTNEFTNAARVSAAKIQNDIDWRAVGNNIVKEMAKSINLTPAQMLEFMASGKWPTGRPPSTIGDVRASLKAVHVGGYIGGTGGAMSSKERNGVPRSASRYPTEVPAILKQGEFVMNQHAVRTYGLANMQAINDRQLPTDFLHTGGSVGPTGAAPFMGAKTLASTLREAMIQGVFGQILGLVQSQQAAGMPSPAGPAVFGGGTGKWRRPGAGRVTSEFGPRWGKLHGGIDLAAGMGSPIYAASDGQVTTRKFHPSWGNHIMIQHAGGKTNYAHMSSFVAGMGQKVAAGQLIGREGSTGNSTGPHLHFEWYPNNGSRVNPRRLPIPFHNGGEIPSLRKGATIRHDNTLVNTHKGETVLTAPVTRALTENVTAGIDGQKIEINFVNPVVREEADLRKMTDIVEKALDKIETKNGRNRRVR